MFRGFCKRLRKAQFSCPWLVNFLIFFSELSENLFCVIFEKIRKSRKREISE
jgi:hypothetical protein